MPELELTQRAYTLRLRGPNDFDWREQLWTTHATVNRGAKVWGDWLLTLRGGLSPILVDHKVLDKKTKQLVEPDEATRRIRRVILALSWLSVETPIELAPQDYIIPLGDGTNQARIDAMKARFEQVLNRLNIEDRETWRNDCLPALSAQIHSDAVWVDRSACFAELGDELHGLTNEAAGKFLFDLMGGSNDYFTMPDIGSSAASEAKDFAIKAGNWLSSYWGSGVKSQSSEIAIALNQLADVSPNRVVGLTGSQAVTSVATAVGIVLDPDMADDALFKRLKQWVGWKGRPSKGAMALKKLLAADDVTDELWNEVRQKCLDESNEQSAKSEGDQEPTVWMPAFRKRIESQCRMPYRTSKDHTWQFAVMLDHSLRRVSAGHTWIKRAEATRRSFDEDAARLGGVPNAAREWLDRYCETRGERSAVNEGYLIRQRAIDGWEEVVTRWSQLAVQTRDERVKAARAVQADWPDDKKFGDSQFFAGSDKELADELPCLADDDAVDVWQKNGQPNADILKDYVAARVAEHDQLRFKVPKYCHPDPLEHPVFVDFGNSRWDITFSALKAVQDRPKVLEKLSKTKSATTQTNLTQKLNSINDGHGVTLGLWDGHGLQSVPLKWQSNRLRRDLDFNHLSDAGATVSRADRLGRALGNAPKGAVSVASVFDPKKEWSGRLQVARKQLDRLAAYLRKHDLPLDDPSRWDDRAKMMLRGFRWFLTFSARLQPAGPWLDYVAGILPEGWTYYPKNDFLKYHGNEGRKGRAYVRLARLPGLRVLSVDLGQRYAAACAVWETLSREQMSEACRTSNHHLPDASAMFLHLQRPHPTKRDKRGEPIATTRLYRRIGPDVLPDGTPHPAPWARLDRQFLIKLQGEERPARRATNAEFEQFNQFREWLGLPRWLPKEEFGANGTKQVLPPIDQLMSEAVDLMRRGLRRHGDIARVAFTLMTSWKPSFGGKRNELSNDGRMEYILDGLLLWQEIAASGDWFDAPAGSLWDEWIVGKFAGPPIAGMDDDLSWPERNTRRAATRASLQAVAEMLVDRDNSDLFEIWDKRWQARNGECRRQLRWLRRWLLPHIARPRVRDYPGGKTSPEFLAVWKQYRQRLQGIQAVGGLSLDRITTIRGLYEVKKAFRQQAEPVDLLKNKLDRGDKVLANFGRRILEAMQQLRENRVKQLASRLVEAAIGVGSEDRLHWVRGKQRPREQIADDRFKACHAVVIENLEKFTPDDSRLRRTNSGLMTWAARQTAKYLSEGCQLHGLHLVQVSPQYTSRQDSRTGVPGFRCAELPLSVWRQAVELESAKQLVSQARLPKAWMTRRERLLPRVWSKQLAQARKKVIDGTRSSRDQFLVDLAAAVRENKSLPDRLRFLQKGAELFASSSSDRSGVLQADLNAAGNIGLKALSDPDWPGAWWSILCDLSDGVVDADFVTGCRIFDPAALPKLIEPPPIKTPTAGRRVKSSRTKIYAWRHPSTDPIRPTLSQWKLTSDYWADAEKELLSHWRKQLQLD